MNPLEANPSVFRSYLARIDPDTKFDFEDVYVLEPLEGMPEPLALICLFTLNCQVLRRYQTLSATEPPRNGQKECDQECQTLSATDAHIDGQKECQSNQECQKDETKEQPALWFTRQYERNACGPVAILHAVMNVTNSGLIDQQKLTEFAANFQTGSSQRAHSDLADAGETKPVDKVSEHFVAFVPKNGHLYELDGRMKGPIDHGSYSDPDCWTRTAFTTIKETILNLDDPSNYRFNVMALTHH